jgi:hypothetical protein
VEGAARAESGGGHGNRPVGMSGGGEKKGTME